MSLPPSRPGVGLARSPPPEDPPLTSVFEVDSKEIPRRRGSFSFLRRSKSGDRISVSRNVSGGKLTKRQRSVTREQEMKREQIPHQPPKLPDLPRSTRLQTFGGESLRSDRAAVITNQVENNRPIPPMPQVSRNNRASPMYSNVPVPPIPSYSPASGEHRVDPLVRTESIAHRGRYSYASSFVSTVSGPRRLRRRKDPTPFNVLIIGARNAGKTSFIDFLRKSLALPASKQRPHFHDDVFETRKDPSATAFPDYVPHWQETEIDGERIGLTLWDSPSLEPTIVDLQLREVSSFLESKFEDTLREERKIARTPGIRDTHIHCVFLVLDPTRLDANLVTANKLKPSTRDLANGHSHIAPHSSLLPNALDENMDLQVFRVLRNKTTVIPVIAKADTITSAHMAHLKRAVWTSLQRSKLAAFEALGLDVGDIDTANGLAEPKRPDMRVISPGHERQRSEISHLDSPSDSSSSFSTSDFDLAKPGKPSPGLGLGTLSPTAPRNPSPSSPAQTLSLPFSIISPDQYAPEIAGRKFPWGFADPYNGEHCDFVRLKEMVFAEWREELREASRDVWYEGWRTARLDGRVRDGGGVGLAR